MKTNDERSAARRGELACRVLRACATSALAWIAATGVPAAAQTPAPHWVGTWTASVEPNARTNLPGFSNQTLRFVVKTSIAGKTARIQLSNVFGTTPLAIGSAHLALHGSGASILPGSDRVLTFGGSESATVPARGLLYSDPVDLDIPELGDVTISLYLPGPAVAPVTGHSFSQTTNYTSIPGNYAGTIDLPVGSTACFTIAPRPCITPWYFITRLEVMAPGETSAAVMLGDSITDGDSGNSPFSEVDTNVRWPAVLASRMLAQKGSPDIAVLNAGISGNQLRGSNGALDRLDRDVLSQPGVKYVVLLEGINDSSAGMIANQLIAIDQQIVDRVHAAGLKIFGATLTPAGSLPGTVREFNRSALSDWIRTSGQFDGVIDFDRAMADPSRPTFMLPIYDSGDHTHPSPTGYRFMGNYVDIGLFKGRDGPYPWSGVTGDVNGDGIVSCADLAAARGAIGLRRGAPGYAPTADFDGNGAIDLRDISSVAKLLPAGTRC